MSEMVQHSALREKLDTFGDPREMRLWAKGDPDYVQQLGLTREDVPTLLAVARLWATTFDEELGEEDGPAWAAPVHAWRAAAQLQAPEAVSVLLEMLDPLIRKDDDWPLDEFPEVFAMIGPASLAPLCAYLAKDGYETFARICASSGLTKLAQRHPSTREAAVAAMETLLKQAKQNDPMVNGSVVADLMELDAREAAATVEQAYADDVVDTTMCGNWNTVRDTWGIEELGLVPEDIAGQGNYLTEMREKFFDAMSAAQADKQKNTLSDMPGDLIRSPLQNAKQKRKDRKRKRQNRKRGR